jgi:hypothetical protein
MVGKSFSECETNFCEALMALIAAIICSASDISLLGGVLREEGDSGFP